MSDAPTKPIPRRKSRVLGTLKALIRARITTGVITILPILITLWVIRLVFTWMRDASLWVVKAFLLSSYGHEYLERLHFDFVGWEAMQGDPLRSERFFQQMPWHVQWGISIFSVLLTIFVLYTIGLFAANMFGRRTIQALEQFVERVPLVKTVYRGLKQVLETFTSDQSQSFRKAALVPFPQEKMRCVAFVTNVFKDSLTGEELCSVFIATTPNPTTGYLQIMRRRDITELNWSVEDAIRCVMSGGILKPDFLTIVPNKDLPEDVPDGVGPSALPPAPEAPPEEPA